MYNVTKRIIQLVKTDLLEVKDESSLNFADVSYDGQFHLFLGNGSVKILLTSSRSKRSMTIDACHTCKTFLTSFYYRVSPFYLRMR